MFALCRCHMKQLVPKVAKSANGNRASAASAKAAQAKAIAQPVYNNTAYSRRLAKRQRIEEKKLSWKDLRQFSQFVTPFKWQVTLAFILTVAVGLTALPMPFIFHTMLDQVFPQIGRAHV